MGSVNFIIGSDTCLIVFSFIMSGPIMDKSRCGCHAIPCPPAVVVSHRGSPASRCLIRFLFELEFHYYWISCFVIALALSRMSCEVCAFHYCRTRCCYSPVVVYMFSGFCDNDFIDRYDCLGYGSDVMGWDESEI